MQCRDRVAIVTGAAGNGMGRSIALTLAREGASVVVNYRTSRSAAEEVVEHIRARGGEAMPIKADVFDETGCRELADATVGAFGRVDICVVGPGGGWHPAPPGELAPLDGLDDLRSEIAPLYNLMPLVLPAMYDRRWGRVVAIAMHPSKPCPAYSYNVAKAARVQALLLAQDATWAKGVTVNVVAPGPVAPIPTLAQAIEQSDHRAAWHNRTNVSPQDVAEGVAFLCSDAGSYITGCTIPYLFRAP